MLLFFFSGTRHKADRVGQWIKRLALYGHRSKLHDYIRSARKRLDSSRGELILANFLHFNCDGLVILFCRYADMSSCQLAHPYLWNGQKFVKLVGWWWCTTHTFDKCCEASLHSIVFHLRRETHQKFVPSVYKWLYGKLFGIHQQQTYFISFWITWNSWSQQQCFSWIQ